MAHAAGLQVRPARFRTLSQHIYSLAGLGRGVAHERQLRPNCERIQKMCSALGRKSIER
jgi:hypothetical protein